MQIAAARPEYLDRNSVPADRLQPFSNLANLKILALFSSANLDIFISGFFTKTCSTKHISP